MPLFEFLWANFGARAWCSKVPALLEPPRPRGLVPAQELASGTIGEMLSEIFHLLSQGKLDVL